MIGMAFAVVAGMMVASSGLFSGNLLLFTALFLVLLSFVLLRFRASTFLVFIAVAAVSAAQFMVASPMVSEAAIGRERGNLPIPDVQTVGRVAGFPEYHAYRSGTLGSWSFAVHCEGLCVSNIWKTRRGGIEVRIAAAPPVPPVRRGDRVLLVGGLREKLFPGGHPVELYVAKPADCRVLSRARHPSLPAWGRAWREAAASRLEAGTGHLPVHQAVLKALVLGYRKEMPPNTLERFRRTGSLHIFAISGLHVGIVGLLLAILLKSFGVPRDWFGVWLLPLLFVYVASTGMKSSALRALTMAAVFLLAPLLRRKPDIPSSVAFAAILLLLFQPVQLMSAGFVFSFTVVAFIVMVFSVVPKFLLQGGWLKSKAVSLVVTSFAAGIASVPLAALYFGMFSPIAFAGNLVVVPLTFGIVLSGWLSVLVPVASSIFNHAAVVFIDLLLGCVGWLDTLPGSSWQVAPPPLFAVVLWYASFVCLFTHAASWRQRLIALGGAGAAILLAWLG